MKVVVIGCGKFGVMVSEQLVRKNHDVAIIDNNPEAFLALSEEFTGRTVCGIGYDIEVLEQAGIATADVLISCASSDSLNAVVANIAKNIFHVHTVIARMYDPIRARMFESMGIYTVSITRLGVDNIMECLEGHRSWRVIRKLGNEDVQFLKVRVPNALVGTKLSDLTVEGKMNLIALERHGHSMLPETDMCCDYNDMLYLAVRRDYLVQAREMLQL